MKKLFSTKISPSCEYCRFGRISPDGVSVLCEKMGIMQKDSSCSKFKYDVLKRRPLREAKIDTNYDKEDFTL